MWQTYINVDTLEHALALLAKYRERCKLIAGGTDLILDLENGRHTGVDILIDISRLYELATIRRSVDGRIIIGGLATHSQCTGSKLLRDYATPLLEAVSQVGSPQLRNRGTVAGNIVTASPANDTIAPLLALDAVVHLRSRTGKRDVPLNSFFTGYRQTAMTPEEMVTAISFDGMRSSERGSFKKFGLRRAQAIAVVNFAAVISFEGSIVQESRLALGCAAPVVYRVREVEVYLKGKPLSDEVIAQAAAMVESGSTPIGDLRASQEYREHLIGTLVKDALIEIRDGHALQHIADKPILLAGANPAEPAPTLHRSDAFCGDANLSFTLNGKPVTINGDTHKTLLHFLREHALLTGSKDGCSEGECGACTIYLDGKAVLGCMVPAARAQHARVETIESIGSPEHLHRVQQAFIDEGAVQCGYCTPGFIMSAVKLLEEVPHPDHEQIKAAIAGNLCRCTGYYKIVSAIEKASSLADGR